MLPWGMQMNTPCIFSSEGWPNADELRCKSHAAARYAPSASSKETLHLSLAAYDGIACDIRGDYFAMSSDANFAWPSGPFRTREERTVTSSAGLKGLSLDWAEIIGAIRSNTAPPPSQAAYQGRISRIGLK